MVTALGAYATAPIRITAAFPAGAFAGRSSAQSLGERERRRPDISNAIGAAAFMKDAPAIVKTRFMLRNLRGRAFILPPRPGKVDGSVGSEASRLDGRTLDPTIGKIGITPCRYAGA